MAYPAATITDMVDMACWISEPELCEVVVVSTSAASDEDDGLGVVVEVEAGAAVVVSTITSTMVALDSILAPRDTSA